jgi:hypothetical protein
MRWFAFVDMTYYPYVFEAGPRGPEWVEAETAAEAVAKVRAHDYLGDSYRVFVAPFDAVVVDGKK